tara:strand:+ start:3240 stop:3539 length:300 start_codon:yes stop_codon:yes gene_type:complete
MPKKPLSIRIASDLHKPALVRSQALGFKTFSEYLETLLRIDIDQKPSLCVTRDENGTRYFLKQDQVSEPDPVITDSVGLMKEPAKKRPRKTATKRSGRR